MPTEHYLTSVDGTWLGFWLSLSGGDVPVGKLADQLSDGSNRTECYVALMQSDMCSKY
jgi:hypothetical protein